MYEVPLPDPGPIRDDIKFVPQAIDNIPSYRPVVGVSLGCDVSGNALPHVDTSDPVTSLGGMGKRLAFKPPPIKIKLRKLKRFVLRWCKRNLVPLDPFTDCSFETWIRNAPYTQARKEQLTELYNKINNDPFYEPNIKDFYVNCFIKDETYDQYKHSRGIYSRTDVFKILVGPIIKLIENEVYKLPYFIKKVPVHLRPAKIMEMYTPDAIYCATDYTSFEGHFVKNIMQNLECVMYDYMVQYLPARDWFTKIFIHTIMKTNHCNFHYFFLEVEATRMSGEMNTSLGNGFSNLMMMLYVCYKRGYNIDEVPGYVEGDDGIFRFTDPNNVPTTEDFAELGFTIKIEIHQQLSTASFCGIIFAPEDLNNITDPISSLLSFGWSTRRYCRSKSKKLKELLRAKSYSMLYSYPGCPILRSLAEYGLRMTTGHRVLFSPENQYEREKFSVMTQYLFRDDSPLIKIKVGNATRILVYEKYGIPVETQLLYEEYLDNLTELVPLSDDLLFKFINNDVLDYSNRYVLDIDYTRKDLDYLPWHNPYPQPYSRLMVEQINVEKTVMYRSWKNIQRTA